MKAQQSVTKAEAQLFFRAACCVISADGKVREKELAVLSEAMGRLGFQHTPEQLRTHAISTCKEIHGRGLDAESLAIASEIRRFCKTPLASHLQQTLASVAASDGVVAEAEQRIVSRFRAALVPSGAGAPQEQPVILHSNPPSRPQLPVSQKASLGMGTGLTGKGMIATFNAMAPRYRRLAIALGCIVAVVFLRAAFEAVADGGKRRPNQPRAAAQRAAAQQAAAQRAAAQQAAAQQAAAQRAAAQQAAAQRAAAQQAAAQQAAAQQAAANDRKFREAVLKQVAHYVANFVNAKHKEAASVTGETNVKDFYSELYAELYTRLDAETVGLSGDALKEKASEVGRIWGAKKLLGL
jgi:hypothetical protein